jgi:hypothetical protein
MDPIIEKNGKWYFYDETWSELFGPYNSEMEAFRHLLQYAKYINHVSEHDIDLTQTDENIKILNTATILILITAIIGGFVSENLSTTASFGCVIILMSFLSTMTVKFGYKLWE